MEALSTKLDFSKIGVMACTGIAVEDLKLFEETYKLYADRITIHVMSLDMTQEADTLPPNMFRDVATDIDLILPEAELHARTALWAVLLTELCKFAYFQWDGRRREESIKKSGLADIFRIAEQINKKSNNQNSELN